MSYRVAVTGVGMISPLGLSAESTWQAMLRGQSGVGPITLFDASHLYVRIACEAKGFNPTDFIEAREARRRDRVEQFTTAAAKEAIEQSELRATEEIADNVAVIIGSAIGGLTTLSQQIHILRDEGPRRLSPLAIPMLMPNGPAGMVGIDWGFRGPSYSPGSACASGADAVGQAAEMVRRGEVIAAIGGGAECVLTPIGIAGFDRTGAMSRRNDPPYHTPQPFDKNRDGLVMGEGAAVLVLERMEFAEERGAQILGEYLGYGASADATHVTAPAEGGVGMARAMQRALRSAGVQPQDVDYINAHGTATDLNDKMETMAIKRAFGECAYQIPVSSTKSMTGHIMGATGALEVIICLMAIRDGVVPPTIHYDTPDPECDLDYVPNEARRHRVRIAMSNAFGFGGHNTALIVKAYEPE